jgi:hypothetical protein
MFATPILGCTSASDKQQWSLDSLTAPTLQLSSSNYVPLLWIVLHTDANELQLVYFHTAVWSCITESPQHSLGLFLWWLIYATKHSLGAIYATHGNTWAMVYFSLLPIQTDYNTCRSFNFNMTWQRLHSSRESGHLITSAVVTSSFYNQSIIKS